ncbi:MAG: hypothetical protein AAFW46_07720 [Pseudomonadota bacterium]
MPGHDIDAARAYFIGDWTARSSERLLFGLIRIRGDSVVRFHEDGTFEARGELFGRRFDLNGGWRIEPRGDGAFALIAALRENHRFELTVRILDEDRFEIAGRRGWLYRRDPHIAHRIR